MQTLRPLPSQKLNSPTLNIEELEGEMRFSLGWQLALGLHSLTVKQATLA
jgi:hypothetical protein